jgi:hypothetical protein
VSVQCMHALVSVYGLPAGCVKVSACFCRSIENIFISFRLHRQREKRYLTFFRLQQSNGHTFLWWCYEPSSCDFSSPSASPSIFLHNALPKDFFQHFFSLIFCRIIPTKDVKMSLYANWFH